MANQISVGCYTFRVRRKGQKAGEEVWETLGAIGGGDGPAFDAFLEEFFAQLHVAHEEDNTRQSLLVVRDFNAGPPLFHGFLESGPWGAAADIVDHTTRDVAHRMSEDEAPLIPFFFLIHTPPESDRGILVLQRHGRRGVKTHFCNSLKRAFGDWQRGYILDFWQHVPGQVLEHLLEGGIRRIELISYEVPPDIADLYAALRDPNQEWDQTRGEVKTQIVAKRGRRWPIPRQFQNVIVGERTFHEVRQELGVEAETVRVTISHRGKDRTVDLAHPGDVSPYYVITEELDLEAGHPTPRSIVRFVRDDLLPSLIEQVYGIAHE